MLNKPPLASLPVIVGSQVWPLLVQFLHTLHSSGHLIQSTTQTGQLASTFVDTETYLYHFSE